MSFLIAVHVNEGIVLASDRRTTYTTTTTTNEKVVTRIGVHTTNTTDKTFICPNGVGISTCGSASVNKRPITGYIQDMIRSKISENTLVESVPQIIIDYFTRMETVPDTKFIVAGYDVKKERQVIYSVRLVDKKVSVIDTTYQGAFWDGETSTLTRLIQDVAQKVEGKYVDLRYDKILWEYFTLQDAIDFARFAVETTINTMRFKNVVETVGGNVDVLLITPDETRWIQKEELK